MKLTKTRVVTLSVTVLLTFFLFSAVVIWAGDLARVLIIPFNINSDKDLSYLQRGVTDMLITRLAQTGKVEPVTLDQVEDGGKTAAEAMNIDRAISAGKRNKVDYVLFGSITLLGNHIGTDAIIVDVSQEKPVLAFNKLGQSQSDLFDHITLLATQINEEIFGYKTVAEQQPPPGGARAAIDAGTNKIESPEPVGAGQPSAAMPAPLGEGGSTTWASRNFKMRIVGVGVGDLDGDGKNETVFASEDKVHIYRNTGGHFAKVKEINNSAGEQIIGIDVADINNNGRAEVFVTNLHSKSIRLKSFVLEWDGSGFSKIAHDLNWYFRVVNDPERGRALLGQQRAGPEIIFSGGVYRLKWSNGQYEPGEELKLPRDANIFSFALGDALNVGQEDLVMFTPFEYVKVLDSKGEEEWVSGEKYGTSTIYLEFPSGDKLFGTEKVMNRIYLPQRIFIADLNGNGKSEIVLARSLGSTRLFTRTRGYKGGYVEGLEWDGKEFKSAWKSAEFSSGYINDYTIADFNNDGRADEIVLAVVTGGSSVFSATKSYIHVEKVGG